MQLFNRFIEKVLSKKVEVGYLFDLKVYLCSGAVVFYGQCEMYTGYFFTSRPR